MRRSAQVGKVHMASRASVGLSKGLVYRWVDDARKLGAMSDTPR